jgi:uncharacterized membrane protein
MAPTPIPANRLRRGAGVTFLAAVAALVLLLFLQNVVHRKGTGIDAAEGVVLVFVVLAFLTVLGSAAVYLVERVRGA